MDILKTFVGVLRAFMKVFSTFVSVLEGFVNGFGACMEI